MKPYTRTPFEPGRYITLFADASYCPTTGAYGYGWWVKYGDPAETRVGHGGGYTDSSLQAEVLALRAGLQWVHAELQLVDTQGKHLVVQSDCTGALARIAIELAALARTLQLARAYTKHVKGHRGHADPRASVNTTCDRHARRMMRTFRTMQQEPSP